MENFAYGEINERSFSNPRPWTVSGRANPLCISTGNTHQDRVDILGGIPDSKVHGANMRPTWVLLAPDGPHVVPMTLAFRDVVSDHMGLHQQVPN